MIKGFLTLLVFQLLGESLAELGQLPIPGPVIGMLLLFIALRLRGRVSAGLQQSSQGLIQNLTLLFLPAGVGIFFLPASVQQQWPAITAAIVGGTLVTMIATALILKALSPSAPGAPADRGSKGGSGDRP